MMITQRQHEVARLYAAGHPRKEVARRLSISDATVRVHLAFVYSRLGVHHRRELAAALLHADVSPAVRANKWGFASGQLLRITGGRRAGRTGTFVRSSCGRYAVLRVGLADVSVKAEFLEPVDDVQVAA